MATEADQRNIFVRWAGTHPSRRSEGDTLYFLAAVLKPGASQKPRDRLRRDGRRDSRTGGISEGSLTLSVCSLPRLGGIRVEVIGEAARHVSEPAREEISAIPWVQIVAMRHRLVHAYFDIDREVLWQTVRHDLPSLIAQLEPLLPNDTR